MTTSTPLVYAYLNHGRWIAECPVCHDALKVKPGFVEWTRDPDRGFLMRKGDRFVCPNRECGADHGVLQWPANREAIEALVQMRPMVNRNWVPGEDAADLIADNIDFGGAEPADLTVHD